MQPTLWNKKTAFVLVVLFALLTTLGARPGVACAQAKDSRLTLAFYYAWYDENTWTPDLVPDMPVQPYRSSDRATIERHVAQAQAAGIDALVVSWWGPQEKNNQTETNLRALLDVAQARGFHATVDFELTSPFYANQADVTAALRYLLETHAQHPAFLRYDGKPVIFFWRQQHYDVATWRALRQQLDPARTTLWIAEGVDLSYQDVFDGHHLYNVTWNPPTDPAYTAAKFRRQIDEYNTAYGTQKLWIATVMPGYDDTHIAGRPGTYIHPRQEGAYYRQTWEAAIASHPEMVVITSFNEWREGTMIEPSVTYGDLYLNLTQELSNAYRQSTDPPPTATPAPTDTPLPPPTATPTLTPLPTATPTFTPSSTPTPTPLLIPTSSPTLSPTCTGTPSPAPTLTATLIPAATPTASETPLPTVSPTNTLPPPSPAHPSSTPTSSPIPSPTSSSGREGSFCPGAMLLPLAILGTYGFRRAADLYLNIKI